MKKTASQFVDDLLAGTLPHVPPSATEQAEVAAFAAEIDAHYAFTQAELEAAMSEARGRIEGAIGVAITDEQLVALSGASLMQQESVSGLQEPWVLLRQAEQLVAPSLEGLSRPSPLLPSNKCPSQ